MGGKNPNSLTLGIVYKGAAIPVYWLVLNKQGNANQRERIALLQRFIRQFRRSGILDDREFIGNQWWQWLSDRRIPYLIRVKENQLLTDRHGFEQPGRSLFTDLKAGKSRSLNKARRIGEQTMGVAQWHEAGEPRIADFGGLFNTNGGLWSALGN